MTNSRRKGKVGEEWRPVKGFERIYEVSDLGRIRRIKVGKGKTPHIMTNSINKKNGYCYVALSKKGMYRSARVHKVVMDAFNPVFTEKRYNKNFTINHIDGNKQNNKLENLEWCTQSENQIKAYQTGLQGLHGLKVICLDDLKVYESATAASKAINGANGEMVARVCRGKRSHYRNHHYAFYDDYLNHTIPEFKGKFTKGDAKTLWR